MRAVVAPIATAASIRLGERELFDEGFAPLDNQVVFGGSVAVQDPSAAVGFALSVQRSHEDAVIADPYPAWTAIGCTGLAIPGARVEVKVTAVVDPEVDGASS